MANTIGRTRRKGLGTWEGYKMDDDDADLAVKYNIQLQDKTRDLINEHYWSSLGHAIGKGGKKQMLPASYQLDTCNWLQVTFDYVSMDVVSGKKLKGAYFLIPETVIIRKRRAVAIVSADGGSTVFRVDRSSELEPAALLETFCSAYRKHSHHGLLTPTTIIAQLVASVFDEQKAEWSSTVEYFTQAQLKNYLYDHLRVEDRQAILQLFVPPSGPRNALIRAWWSPYSMKLEQRVNQNDVYDAHRPAHDRCATFDGPIHLSEMRGLPGQDLRDELAMSMQEVVRRVSEQLPLTQRLWRAQFYFKLGLDGRVWFLWCGSMQFVQSSISDAEVINRKRPTTPVCKPSPAVEDEAQMKDDRDDDKSLWNAGTCPSCGRKFDKPLEMPIPYMSLLRRLSPALHELIMDERETVRQACKTEESWNAYLHRLNAPRFLRYGESLHIKFPRPAPALPLADAAAPKLRHGGQPAAVAAAPPGGGGRSEELRQQSDRRYVRAVVKSVHGGAPLSDLQRRELVLYAATSPEGFYKRAVAVCEDCAISVGMADMRKAQADLMECTAPLDFPSKRLRQRQLRLQRVRQHGRDPRAGAVTVLGFAGELAARPDLRAPPSPGAESLLGRLPSVSRPQGAQLGGAAADGEAVGGAREEGQPDDAEGEEAPPPPHFPLLKSTRRGSGVTSNLGSLSPQPRVVAGGRRNRGFQLKAKPSDRPPCTAFVRRREKFRIEQYKEAVGTTLADVRNMSEELQGLDDALMAEEAALEGDGAELAGILEQSYQEMARSPSRMRQRTLNAARRNAGQTLSPRSRKMIDAWRQLEAIPFRPVPEAGPGDDDAEPARRDGAATEERGGADASTAPRDDGWSIPGERSDRASSDGDDGRTATSLDGFRASSKDGGDSTAEVERIDSADTDAEGGPVQRALGGALGAAAGGASESVSRLASAERDAGASRTVSESVDDAALLESEERAEGRLLSDPYQTATRSRSADAGDGQSDEQYDDDDFCEDPALEEPVPAPGPNESAGSGQGASGAAARGSLHDGVPGTARGAGEGGGGGGGGGGVEARGAGAATVTFADSELSEARSRSESAGSDGEPPPAHAEAREAEAGRSRRSTGGQALASSSGGGRRGGGGSRGLGVEWGLAAGTVTHVERLLGSRPMAQVGRLRTETEERRLRRAKAEGAAGAAARSRAQSLRSTGSRAASGVADPQQLESSGGGPGHGASAGGRSSRSTQEEEVEHLLAVYGVPRSGAGGGLRQKLLPSRPQRPHASSYSPLRGPVHPKRSSAGAQRRPRQLAGRGSESLSQGSAPASADAPTSLGAAPRTDGATSEGDAPVAQRHGGAVPGDHLPGQLRTEGHARDASVDELEEAAAAQMPLRYDGGGAGGADSAGEAGVEDVGLLEEAEANEPVDTSGEQSPTAVPRPLQKQGSMYKPMLRRRQGDDAAPAAGSSPVRPSPARPSVKAAEEEMWEPAAAVRSNGFETETL